MTITLIVVFALLLRILLHRAITWAVESAAEGRVSRLVQDRVPCPLRPAAGPLVSQRARTIGSVLRSISSAVVLVIALAMTLAEFDVSLGPILANAGIVGVALGFGAQSLVRDFLSGMFLMLEDQYDIGDLAGGSAARWRRSACASSQCATVRAPSGTSATARSCGWATRVRVTPWPWST